MLVGLKSRHGIEGGVTRVARISGLARLVLAVWRFRVPVRMVAVDAD